MSNAAIYVHPDAFVTTGPRLMGRHSAGESFLRGLLRYADTDAFYFFNGSDTPPDRMRELILGVHPTDKPVHIRAHRSIAAETGVLNLPVPGINEEAWHRLPLGEAAYGVCGITHTTATDTIMRMLGEYFLAPLHDHDVLICTSSAVRASIESQLDGIRDFITQHYGTRRLRTEPRRVTIPLGVNVDDFATRPEQRKAWRERLDIPEDAFVALYVGRFEPRAKMNPALMAQALEKAAKLTSRPIFWVNSGWTETEEATKHYHESSRAFCPSVHYRALDGRPADVRFSIWSVADAFISLSDNIQETFGLTPVEAMAAGLPCVVTDWDGYRDTVRDGEDGFRIPTVSPAPGVGRDLAYAFATRTLAYGNYVGAAAQFTAVDLEAAARALSALADNPDLRRRMGAQAQARAREVFDWRTIIPQYQGVWAEQDARRRTAPQLPRLAENPFRPDPFRLFAGYPTHHFGPEWQVSPAPDLPWMAVETRLNSMLARASHFNSMSLVEARLVYDWLAVHGPATAAQVAEQFPQPRRPFVQRALLWLARFGVVTLKPPI